MITLWVRARDRREPQWFLRSPERGEEGRYETPLINVGDGDAFQVEISGRGCVVETRNDATFTNPDGTIERVFSIVGALRLVPRLPAGEAIPLVISWEVGEHESDRAVLVKYRYSPTKHRKDLETELRIG